MGAGHRGRQSRLADWKALRAPGEPNMLSARRSVAVAQPPTAPGLPVPALNSNAHPHSKVAMDDGQTRAWRGRVAQEIAPFGVTYAIDLCVPDLWSGGFRRAPMTAGAAARRSTAARGTAP